MVKEKRYPLVTVGVAVFNGGKFLVETLEHIRKQSYPNFELIIVDDASTDDSYQVCQEWKNNVDLNVQLHRHDANKGLPATCNSILSIAKGEYIQFVDQDDLLLPEKLMTDVAIFGNLDQDTALVYSSLKLIDENGMLTGEDYFERIGFNGNIEGAMFSALVKKNFIPAPTVMMRTSAIQKVGGYDETLLFQDWDMWLLLSKKFRFFFHDQCNVYYRLHNSSMMANKDVRQTIKRNEANIQMFKKHLGHSKEYDKALIDKLQEMSVYSYFISDQNAHRKMWIQLRTKFNAKLFLYFVMSSLGISHPANWIKTDSARS